MAGVEAEKKEGPEPGPSSRGARLAAERAARAAQKAAKRGKTPLLQAAVNQRATRVAEWLRPRRTVVTLVGLALVLTAGTVIAWRLSLSTQEARATALLGRAAELASAEIQATPPPATPGDNAPPKKRTFKTLHDRASAVLKLYRRVHAKYPHTTAAAWAYLGEGDALLQLEKPAEALQAFRAVHAGDDAFLQVRSIEGSAYALEAQKNYSGALKEFQKLEKREGADAHSLGELHTARMHVAMGQRAEAKRILQTLIEKLRKRATKESLSFAYTQQQAEQLLGILDPSLAPKSSPTASGLEGIDPARLQELLRQLKTRQAPGGGAGGGGGPDEGE